MTKLSVNINRIALLRNTRNVGVPNVMHAARIAVDAGADGITVHPRPDQRHIRPGDVHDLADYLRDKPRVEFNLEGNPFPEFMALVDAARPDQVTLVPDAPDAATSDHGWDLAAERSRLTPIIRQLRDRGARVSLFMDIDSTQWRLAREMGADRVELYTEPYAAAYARGDASLVLGQCAAAASAAQAAGLGVNAGHDLNRQNLPDFLRIPGILEVSIGHALIADAIELGLHAAVKAYLALMP